MAKQYGLNAAEDFKAANLMSFGKSFSRLNGQPLDKSEIWYNDLQALRDYVATDAAYVGQKVVYIDTTAGTVSHYSVELDGTLKPLGDTESLMAYIGELPEGTDATTVIDYINKKTSGIATDAALSELQSAVDALEEAILKKSEEGHKHTMSDITDLSIPSKVSELENDSKFQTDSEVKATVEAAIAATGHAIFEKVDSVPTLETAKDNVLYLVMNGETNHYDIYAKVNTEVVLLDDTTVDLSNYYNKSEVDDIKSGLEQADINLKNTLTSDIATAKQEAIDAATYDDTNVKADIKAIADDYLKTEDKTSLENKIAEKATKATTAAGYGITDVYTKTETDNAITAKITEINGGESAGEVLGQLNDYKTANDGRVSALEELVGNEADGEIEASGLVKDVADIIAKLDTIDSDADINVIESVKVNGTALEVAEDKSVNIEIPAATQEALGTIKGSDAVSIDNGQITKVTTDILANGSELLVLKGGSGIFD